MNVLDSRPPRPELEITKARSTLTEPDGRCFETPVDLDLRDAKAERLEPENLIRHRSLADQPSPSDGDPSPRTLDVEGMVR
jgi:hypothetical protein